MNDMKLTLKNKDGTITFPLVDGYRDEDAIRESSENQHRIYCWSEGYWEAVIDLNAMKVLTINCRIAQITNI